MITYRTKDLSHLLLQQNPEAVECLAIVRVFHAQGSFRDGQDLATDLLCLVVLALICRGETYRQAQSISLSSTIRLMGSITKTVLSPYLSLQQNHELVELPTVGGMFWVHGPLRDIQGPATEELGLVVLSL